MISSSFRVTSIFERAKNVRGTNWSELKSFIDTKSNLFIVSGLIHRRHQIFLIIFPTEPGETTK